MPSLIRGIRRLELPESSTDIDTTTEVLWLRIAGQPHRLNTLTTPFIVFHVLLCFVLPSNMELEIHVTLVGFMLHHTYFK